MSRPKKEKKEQTPAKKSALLVMIPLTVTFEKDILARLFTMKKAKGFPNEQDLVRLGTVEMLERAGY
jgi:hypothetical protein